MSEQAARAYTADSMADLVQGVAGMTRSMARAVGAIDDDLPSADAALPAVSALLGDLEQLLQTADLTQAADRKKIDDRVAAMQRYGRVAELEAALGEAQQSASTLARELMAPPPADDPEAP